MLTLLCLWVVASAHASPFLSSWPSSLIPASRRGRAGLLKSQDNQAEVKTGGPAIRVESNASEDTNILKSLIESVLNTEAEDASSVEVEEDLPLPLPVSVVPQSPVGRPRVHIYQLSCMSSRW